MTRFRIAAVLVVSSALMWGGMFPAVGEHGWGMAAPMPVLAQTEPPNPWENDPLRLVPFATTSHRVYSLSQDLWEVWVCRVPGWDTQVDLGEVVDFLNANVGPFFRELSDGMYQPVFRAGGRVESSDEVASGPGLEEGDFAPGCAEAVRMQAAEREGERFPEETGPAGALIVVEFEGYRTGHGTFGNLCPEGYQPGCEPSYPTNGRRVVVGAGAVVAQPPLHTPFWSLVVHEMGHALAWPHSYSGKFSTTRPGALGFYDNPMDIMSNIPLTAPQGTTVYHRYSAGWIDPSSVDVYRGGQETYLLHRGGADAGLAQMVVIPAQIVDGAEADESYAVGDGHFYVLGVRRLAGLDAGVHKVGVEVYEIDQRRQACESRARSWPSHWPCFAVWTRIAQAVPPSVFGAVDHVISIDESIRLGETLIKVISADADSFVVSVDTRESGRFLDDDGLVHEQDIETIASRGITLGCGVRLFCPDRLVTRAEMSAFLVRSFGRGTPAPRGALGAEPPWDGLTLSGAPVFTDVSPQAWFAPFVEQLAAREITVGYGDGSFRPDRSVTRGEMAVLLTRTFGIPTAAPTGMFEDVPPDIYYAGAVEALYQAGITVGCQPPASGGGAGTSLYYCPSDEVSRAEMASFLARVLQRGQ